MKKNAFKPLHINATAEDLAGNNGIGRYILLPGSYGRVQEIASHFDTLVINEHARGHYLYLGTINHNGHAIDVATISTGMGCPSAEIILHELFHLGGKRFLRVGTAGSLQPFINIGDIVNAQASVRDEDTTQQYLPISFPAIASIDMIEAIIKSADKMGMKNKLHTGIVHCKSSFYAREFGAGPESERNNAFMKLLSDTGVLATEMETATLFIQSQLYNYQLTQSGNGPQSRVLCGAILGIVGSPPHQFATDEQTAVTIERLTKLGIEAIKYVASHEQDC